MRCTPPTASTPIELGGDDAKYATECPGGEYLAEFDPFSRHSVYIKDRDCNDERGDFGPTVAATRHERTVAMAISEKRSAESTRGRWPLLRAVGILEKARGDLDIGQLVPDAGVVKISVIGVGMRSHAGVAKQMFQALADKGINIQVISTSEIKISVLIAEEYVELALRALHTAYGLDAD